MLRSRGAANDGIPRTHRTLHPSQRPQALHNRLPPQPASLPPRTSPSRKPNASLQRRDRTALPALLPPSRKQTETASQARAEAIGSLSEARSAPKRRRRRSVLLHGQPGSRPHVADTVSGQFGEGERENPRAIPRRSQEPSRRLPNAPQRHDANLRRQQRRAPRRVYRAGDVRCQVAAWSEWQGFHGGFQGYRRCGAGSGW